MSDATGTVCDCCGTYQGTGQQFIRYSLVTDTGYSTVGGEQCSVEAETPLIVCKGCDLSRLTPWLAACPLTSMVPEQPAGPPND